MEMVEKVALEIARKRIGVKPEAWTPNLDLVTEWDRNTARAAIEAMREPTEAMVNAVAYGDYITDNGEYGSAFSDLNAQSVWRDLIDAALTEAAPSKPE